MCVCVRDVMNCVMHHHADEPSMMAYAAHSLDVGKREAQSRGLWEARQRSAPPLGTRPSSTQNLQSIEVPIWTNDSDPLQRHFEVGSLHTCQRDATGNIHAFRSLPILLLEMYGRTMGNGESHAMVS